MHKKIANLASVAIALGINIPLIVMIITTTHKGRLDAFFTKAAADFLMAYKVMQGNPTMAAKKQCSRCKVLVDLIRARQAWVGERRPSVVSCLNMFEPIRAQLPAPSLHLVKKAA